MSETFNAAFTMSLSTAARKMRTLFDSRVRESGLTLARARILLLLDQDREWNQRELAEMLDIEQPSIVTLLDGLETQGLISRAVSKRDRRSNKIDLTDKANDQVNIIKDVTLKTRQDLLSEIDRQSLETTLSVLQKIADNAGRAPDAQNECGRGRYGKGSLNTDD